MLFVDEKTKLFIVIPVTSDKEEEVKKAMEAVLNYYRKYGHTLKVIRFDNAKLFSEKARFQSTLKTWGISVEPCDPDRHVRLVEAAIGYLKRTFKCILAGLPYKLPPQFYKYAILDAACKINMAPNKSNRYQTPIQLFTQLQPDATIDLRFNFGELVSYFRKPIAGSATDVKQERVGIVLGKREVSRSGALHIYDIDKQTILPVHQVRRFAGTDEDRRGWYNKVVAAGNGYSNTSKIVEIDKSDDEFDMDVETSKPKINENESKDVISKNQESVIINENNNDTNIEEESEVSKSKDKESSVFINTLNVGNCNELNDARIPKPICTDPHAETICKHNLNDARIPKPICTDPHAETICKHELNDARIPKPICTDPHAETICKHASISSSLHTHKQATTMMMVEPTASDVQDNKMLQDRDRITASGGGLQDLQSAASATLKSIATEGDIEGDEILKSIMKIVKSESTNLEQELERVTHLIDAFTAITQCERNYGVFETRKGILDEILQIIETKTAKFISKDVWNALNKEGVKQALPSTLVLKAKVNEDNSFNRIKARLVCLGNLQRYYNTLLAKSSIESPTVSIQSVFIMLAILAKEDLEFATFDIKGAFLHADIEEEVYVRISKDVANILCEHLPAYREYLQSNGTMIIKLEKCLYGLRQSPRAWYEVIKKIIMNMGYKPVSNDTCLFVRHNKGKSGYLALYVDDMLIVASREDIQEFNRGLNDAFKSENVTANIGESQVTFLGMKITKKGGYIEVSQQQYIETLIEDDDLDLSKSYATPHPTSFSQDKSKDLSPKSPAVEYFRKKTMQCMYVAVRTRPDILLDIVVLAGRLESPSTADVAILRRILVYLYNTRESGLIFKNGAWDFWAAVDASFNTYENGRGHSGILMFLDRLSAAILAKSLKQKVVTNSSTGAELVCLNEAVLHILYIADILKELLPTVKVYPIKIYNDNKSMITLVKQPVVNRQGRSKFMNRALFKVNENVEAGEIVLLYENTEDLVADFLTKALYGERFQTFRIRIMGCDKPGTRSLGGTMKEVEQNLLMLLESDKRGLCSIEWLEAF